MINGYFGGKYSKDGAGMVRKRHNIGSQEPWDSRFDCHHQDLDKSFNLSCPWFFHLECKQFD